MLNNAEHSVNPFDALYNADVVKEYFSLESITRERARLEVYYWIFITQILIERGHSKARVPSSEEKKIAQKIGENFKYEDLTSYISTTGHEIKALEYALRDKFIKANLPAVELLHWGLTSQDIVDPVYTVAIRNFVRHELNHMLNDIMFSLSAKADEFGRGSIFPARTHGQLAVPTTMQQAFTVFTARLNSTSIHVSNAVDSLQVKFSGAVGTLAVHKFIDPHFVWQGRFDELFDSIFAIGVRGNTTQVNPNDDKARLFSALIGVNNVLIGLAQDIWQYFSYGYLTIKRSEGHVGSSTMAQKNNPIEFENVEGMLQHVNAELHFMIDKLTRSRMQRDLSDSVVQRFYGLMFSQMWYAYRKIKLGIDKLEFNGLAGKLDVHQNCQVYAELVQSMAKLSGTDRFEEVKHLFSKQLSLSDFAEILDTKFPEHKEVIMKHVINV